MVFERFYESVSKNQHCAVKSAESFSELFHNTYLSSYYRGIYEYFDMLNHILAITPYYLIKRKWLILVDRR